MQKLANSRLIYFLDLKILRMFVIVENREAMPRLGNAFQTQHVLIGNSIVAVQYLGSFQLNIRLTNNK